MERIEIYVHDEKRGTTLIEVNKNDLVAVIEKKLQINGSILIYYNNMFLVNTLTFGFYGISNGEHLYISNSFSLKTLTKVTKTLNEKLNLLSLANIKQTVSDETARFYNFLTNLIDF